MMVDDSVIRFGLAMLIVIAVAKLCLWLSLLAREMRYHNIVRSRSVIYLGIAFTILSALLAFISYLMMNDHKP